MEQDFAPRTEAWRARVGAAFDAPGMLRSIGADIVEIAPGRVVLGCPITPAFHQQHGYGHAGLTFTLGDTAAGFAAQTLMEETDGVMTIELKINLMAPAAGDRLRAIGMVERAGKRITVVRAEVWAEAEGRPPTQIALLQGTMMRMENMA